MRKTIVSFAIMVALLVSLVGTAAAQDTTPTDVPQEDPAGENETGVVVFTHPVIKVLSAYFDRNRNKAAPVDETEGDETEGDETEGDETEGDETEDEGEDMLIGEQIAALHEQGMGFGVLVKIFAMAEASQMACEEANAAAEGDEDAEECVPVTAEELVESFQSGSGMGALFKQYGKPALLGVGHVKKELKKLEKEKALEEQAGEDADDEVAEGETEGEDDETTLSATGKGNGNNGKGNGNGNGNGKNKNKNKNKDNKPPKARTNGNGKGKGKP